jgi:hypothetical protein
MLLCETNDTEIAQRHTEVLNFYMLFIFLSLIPF